MLHFDAFGRVPDVVRRIESAIPDIFTGEPLDFIPMVTKTVRDYAGQNKWEYVAVSISKGLARPELDEFIDRDIEHEGPIIIDPTGSTVGHNTYPSRKGAEVQKERLIKVNEQTGDVMVIIYGLDKLDRPVQMELLMKRVRMAGGSLELLEKSLSARQNALDAKVSAQRAEKINELKDRLKRIGRYGESTLHSENINMTDAGISAELFVILAMVRAMHDGIDDADALRALNNIEVQVGQIPREFKNLSVSYAPYRNLAMDMARQEQREQAEMKKDAAAPFTAPDVRDADNDGNVDPHNKYAGSRMAPTHVPK